MEIQTGFTCVVDRQEVYKLLGYSRGCQLPGRIIEMVADAEVEERVLTRPHVATTPVDVLSVCADISYMVDREISWISARFKSEVLATLLKRCHKAVLFVVTIGDGLEKRVAELAEQGKMLQAVVLDAVGSEAVDQLAELAHQMLRRVAQRNDFYCSNRFSPGYCDWDITQQQELFRFFDFSPVQLSEHCFMLPRKSISGLVGISRDPVQNFNPCRTCSVENCRGRRD